VLRGMAPSSREAFTLKPLGQLNTVFLDKTGTLTYGVPVVSELRTADGVSEEMLLETAASAERNSEHPLTGDYPACRTAQDYSHCSRAL